MGLNRVKMVQSVMKGQALISNGPILTGNWAYYSEYPKLNMIPIKRVNC
jgi:hypothetical protein